MGASVRIIPLGLQIPQKRTPNRAPKERREECVLATLSVLKFNDPSGADRVLLALQGMQERQLITLQDAAVVSWPQGRKKPQTRQLHSMGGAGALDGAFWGFLFGLIFFIPLLRMALADARGSHLTTTIRSHQQGLVST